MIECKSCHTLNPDSERVCLACRSPFAGPVVPPSASPAPAAARCAAGHPIDPSWKACPYCERLQAVLAADSASHPESSGGAGAKVPSESLSPKLPQAPNVPLASRATRVEDPTWRRGDNGAFLSNNGIQSAVPPSLPEVPRSSPPAVGHSETRKLVAVLVAPSLGLGGKIFAVRAGRNSIGADRTSDVVLEDDPEVSREHSVLLHRKGWFYLADRLSTNGTWLNGREIPVSGAEPLHNRDRIRCGATQLIFLTVDAEGEVESASEEPGSQA